MRRILLDEDLSPDSWLTIIAEAYREALPDAVVALENGAIEHRVTRIVINPYRREIIVDNLPELFTEPDLRSAVRERILTRVDPAIQSLVSEALLGTII